MRWAKFGLITFFVMAASSSAGCSFFGGLDDAQEASATYLNSFFSKSDKPSAEERYQQIVSVVSVSNQEFSAKPQYKADILKAIRKFMISGVSKPYYLADYPKEPHTDTRKSIIVRFPKGTFNEANKAFAEENESDEEAYRMVVVNKEGENWKVVQVKEIDKKDVVQANIDWIEVSPTDYLN
ncbi:hypothetical protein [Shimazuella kribbensis]|uniref:hypothetical protein n=1 Tax=Shimazuella kribbensis TaxID=139808 RepID=UPI000410361D|nr:hypothetical protein [Shimazuella kribbensis]